MVDEKHLEKPLDSDKKLKSTTLEEIKKSMQEKEKVVKSNSIVTK